MSSVLCQMRLILDNFTDNPHISRHFDYNSLYGPYRFRLIIPTFLVLLIDTAICNVIVW